jgi:hypothetical protein
MGINLQKLTEQYKKIKHVEPYITALVCELAKKIDVPLAGLENRLKSWRTTVEKATVRTRLNDLTKINDIVRYTMVLPNDEYGIVANEIISNAEEFGIYVEKVINYWTNDSVGYNGVNITARCKGVKIEIQFHTSDSLRVKNEENHAVYEKYRMEKDPRKKEEYRKQLIKIGKKQQFPVGYTLIKEKEKEKQAQ